MHLCLSTRISHGNDMLLVTLIVANDYYIIEFITALLDSGYINYYYTTRQRDTAANYTCTHLLLDRELVEIFCL